MMFWYGDHTSGWGWLLMTVGMVAFWALLIAGFVFLARSSDGGPRSSAQAAAPEQVLADRFARGDIDDREYTSRLATLRGQVHS